MSTPDDNVDIDVCLGCGRYYSCTPSLVNRWRELYNPKPGEVMPQLCWKCLCGGHAEGTAEVEV